MAQIKKIVKPGDLIRGAKVGVAGLDKDGNVVGMSGIAVPSPEVADIGKVLTAAATGPVWLNVPGASHSYFHMNCIWGNRDDPTWQSLSMSAITITPNDTPITSFADFVTTIKSVTAPDAIPCSGSVIVSNKLFIISWLDTLRDHPSLDYVQIRGHYEDSVDYLETINITPTDYPLIRFNDIITQIT